MDLIVANGGGHLSEAVALAPRLSFLDPVWVTDPGIEVTGLSTSRQVVRAHHPTTKHPVNAARNYWLARGLFSSLPVSRVISTGAALSVPFVLRASELRIPCHYIESATRVTGPSLSGRMLERLRGVHLYRQFGDWGGPRWQQGPCVFDGVSIDEGPGHPVRRILISLGTHSFAFTALVDRLAALLQGRGIQGIWQLGSTPAPPGLPGSIHQLLPPDELQSAIIDADVVVGHAGVGLTLTCLQAGKVPVLVPRRRARREHTDDHQAQLSGELDSQGLAVVSQVGELSFEHLEQAAGLVVNYDEPPPFELVD